MAAGPLLRDRLSFLHRLPVLLKGTSDDEAPCPGYLFEEIAKISHESLGSSQCLLEYLLSRLQSGSGHVKLKVLKILRYLCSHGSSSFLLILQCNSALIQEAAGFAGPPDPLHGNSLYQKDLGSALFSDTLSLPPSGRPPRALPPAGMGPQARPQSALQGFGYSKERGRLGSAGGALLSTIQKAAEVVASAMRPRPEGPSTPLPALRDDTYQPAATPAASHGPPAPGKAHPGAAPTARALRHRPGQAGGGWEEADSSPGSQSSSQGNGDTGSRSGSDSPSGASRELGDLAEWVKAVSLSDCRGEASLVRAVLRGPRAFLTREEAQHFVRECGLLNCEAVLELLLLHLSGTGERVQMRALGAVSSLGTTDLLAQEHILLRARPRLQELSMGSPGPVTSKATKILRHLEASCRPRPLPQRPSAGPGPLGPAASDACAGPSDLLTDTEPFAGGQAFLQPLSSLPCVPRGAARPLEPQPSPAPHPYPDTSPLSPPGDTRSGQGSSRLTGSGEQGPRSGEDSSDVDPPYGGPELGPGPAGCLRTPTADGSSSSSLFAGMELVACPCPVGAGAAAEKPTLPSPAPWASPRAAPGSELSAFAFLNA
ncbi:AP-4 complex accessory subunit tepsin isoform X2 [Choloepus didactylus]|uniref:AP-4 complex accessory subunit tepsin isoform X2 n=1 Tax=Choloepus didactylus TaxID=27675 RepID=UPI00189F8283|nr:AP-4 complex accessory subunit tepsin isoform X2 [Choloepus didactylus]